jgi:hypothetical protein
MTDAPHQADSTTILRMRMGEFWSGDLGLTLVSISLVILVFVITPLREAGLPGRLFFDLLVLALMVSGALVVKQHRAAAAITIAILLISAAVLGFGRVYPTPFLR